MINLLIRIFVKDYKNVKNEKVRERYGVFSGIMGVALNVVLFAFKLFAGIITGAISITADAFNNLGDAGSSIVTMVGFKMAGVEADEDHPFGHGRIEYITALLVSVAILVMGFELLVSSIEKIVEMSSVEFSLLSIIILAVAVVVKFWMFLYNRKLAKLINSTALSATATDSISDTISTAVVLVGSVVAYYFNINIDAYLGIAVSAFILYSGINACKDAISPLVGEKPDPDLVKDVQRLVISHDKILGIHDVIFHNYGVGKYMVTLHAEVDSSEDVMILHEIIDHIEIDIKELYGVDATIHMDPIETNNESITAMRIKASKIVKSVNTKLTIHDFRMTKAFAQCNLIFDILKPAEVKMSSEEIIAKVKECVAEELNTEDMSYYVVTKVDNEFI